MRENKVDRAAREFMCANITFFNQVRLDFEDFCSNQRHTREDEEKMLSIARGFSAFGLSCKWIAAEDGFTSK